MSFKSIYDHLRRKPIQAMGQVSVEVQTEGGGTATTEKKQSTASFYLHFFLRDKPAFAGMIMIVIFLAWSLIEGISQELSVLLRNPHYSYALLPSNPVSSNINFNNQLLPPSLNHFPNQIFGTDQLGRSIFAEILYAMPHDAIAPVVVVGSAVLIGMFLGTAAGYLGGWADEIMMRLTDAFLSLPFLIFAITIAILIGSGFTSLLWALVIIWWPTYARFFRVQALTIRQRGYIESAKLNGVNPLKILIRHIIPNSIDPVIAYMTLDFGTVILVFASLAFLGIGIDTNYPELGFISSIGLSYFPQVWWWSIIPGIVIGLIVVAFTLAGDRLQDLISGRMSY
jgi:peptide/nickel transport system permease protein